MSSIPVITIDGPSGAGKGTICRLLAKATGYKLLDSGALYRLTALSCEKKGLDMDDAGKVAELALAMDIVFRVEAESTTTLLAGENVSRAIRQENIGMLASKVAAYPEVREALLERQRKFLQMPGLLADGRDMGTVVFPKAKVKVYLTASAEARAQRRLLQLGELESNTELYQSVLADIRARDEKDSKRSSAPLKPADDAVIVDCTEMSIDEVFQTILAKIQEKV